MRPFVFILITAVLFSCTQSAKVPDDFDYGKTGDGVYTNKYFGMKVTIPANWIVQTKEQVDSIMSKGKRILQEKNKEIGAYVEKVLEHSPTLLMVFKYPTDSVLIGYNPYFMIMAEKLDPLSGIKTGLDYLENERKLMEQAKIGYHVTSDYSVKKIGSKEFDVLRFTKAVGEVMDVQRVYHVRIEKGFALNIIISHGSEKQEKELLDVLQKIRFN
jgi:hypothetical protein